MKERENSLIYLLVILTFFSLLLFFGIIRGFFVFLPKLTVLVIIIGLSFLLKKQKEFFADWFFFLTIIYLSDTARGLIYFLISKFHLPVYCEYILKIEKTIFPANPSIFLQAHLLKDLNFGLLEKILTFFHGTHFVAFLIVGFFIWLKDKEYFGTYKKAFYFLLATGLSFYAMVPTAPPWMASQMFGLLPKLIHFNLEIYNAVIPDLTSGFNTDPVAAMPSLHAAFPFLCSLILFKKYKLKAFPFYLYTGLIFFTIVYTGDHYITDILAGIVLSLISFLLAVRKTNSLTATDFVPVPSDNLKTNKAKIVAGTLILMASIIIGQMIKPELKEYYNDYHHLNFVDFTNNPKKADANYLIAFYLGNYEIKRQNKQKALEYFEKALRLVQDPKEKRLLEHNIKRALSR